MEKPTKSWADTKIEIESPEDIEEETNNLAENIIGIEPSIISVLITLANSIESIEKHIRIQTELMSLYYTSSDDELIDEKDDRKNTDSEAEQTTVRSPPKIEIKATEGDDSKLKEAIKSFLSDDEYKGVNVAEEENNFKVFLPWLNDTNKFRNIAQAYRKYGGEYIKDGRNSHFKIPKQ